MNLTDAEFCDITRITLERCRKDVMLSAQLLDEEQTAALTTTIAVDMIEATINVVTDGSADRDEYSKMLKLVITNIMIALQARHRAKRDEMP